MIRFSPSETQRIRADPSQLHETLNLYVSPGAYIFEPASSSIPTLSLDSDGQTFLSEKDVRESLYVDRRTGRMGLNGEMSELEVSLASSAELSPSASARVLWSDWERTFPDADLVSQSHPRFHLAGRRSSLATVSSVS